MDMNVLRLGAIPWKRSASLQPESVLAEATDVRSAVSIAPPPVARAAIGVAVPTDRSETER
eukprot:5494719-Amphidinium_carterae.1